MRHPFISIIIPTYNEQERIGELLEYIGQCCAETPHEIIVADGGSNDRTVQIAKKSGAKVLHCSKKGRAPQMNRGAEHSKGSILYFLHADTFPPKNFVESIKRSFREGCRSGCFRLTFDDPHPILKFYGWCTRFKWTLFRFGDQSLFVEKTLFQQVRGFDESMIVMEDQKIVRELKKMSRFCLADATVTTSARRYKINGIFRLQAVFFLIVLFYYFGAPQETLVHVYNEFID
ncbi:MAG: TIGR04283 family arsenosugar biosynthesis glycosyltransferase [Balneolaceae bacterium]|nr:TIGR04283 family arsenosugar biosynthesis glycosyltransferase [Balneolaceae bacterium]